MCDELDLRPPFGGDERSAGSSTKAARVDERPLVLFEARAAEGAYDRLAEALAEHPEAERAVLAEGAEALGLWRYREGTGEALARHQVVKLDVALPLARLADGLAAIERAALEAAPSLRPFLFGHLLDGNVHVNLGDVPDDRRRRSNARSSRRSSPTAARSAPSTASAAPRSPGCRRTAPPATSPPCAP